MNQYKLKIEIHSPLATRLMADTIWGHICYGILFTEGEDKLKEFLDSYGKKDPPLIISTPFPENLIPMPKIYYEKTLKINNLKDYRNLKIKKKVKYLPAFEIIGKEKVNLNKIIEDIIENEKKGKNGAEKINEKVENRFRNSINRMQFTTSEDGLYQVEEYWYYRSKLINSGYKYNVPIFDIYIITIYDKEYILKLFKNGLEYGYGADTTTGKGKIIVKDEVENFNFPKNGKRAIALAPFVPSFEDYSKIEKDSGLFAEVWTKYPKVHNSLKNMTNPFKKPIVFYKEGATISFENGEKPLFIGQCLENVHHLPQVKQYAMTPLLWVDFETNNI